MVKVSKEYSFPALVYKASTRTAYLEYYQMLSIYARFYSIQKGNSVFQKFTKIMFIMTQQRITSIDRQVATAEQSP